MGNTTGRSSSDGDRTPGPPIFVLGCDRSGTSLLRRVLNAHPNIACPTETKFIYQLVKVFDTPQSLQGLKNAGASEEDVLRQMRLFISHFLDSYAGAAGKRRWAEKTTHNVNCVGTIDRIFAGEPLYLAIARHGLDVAYSLATLTHDVFTVLDKYRYDGADTALAGIRHWASMNRRIAAFADRAGSRLLHLRYEDLTTGPEATLRRVCEFLGEPWDEGLLEYNRKTHDSGWEDPQAARLPSIVPNSGRYRAWPPSLQKSLFHEARDVFESLGYEV